MKRGVLALLAALVGCGDNQDPGGAAELWQRIHDLNYRGFARAPGYETTRPSDTAHSDMVDIYVNPVIADFLAAGGPQTAWPLDSLVVKDGFADDGEHTLVAVMEKRADGWYWAEYTDVVTGEAKFSGRPDTCLECHVPTYNDHLNAFLLPQ